MTSRESADLQCEAYVVLICWCQINACIDGCPERVGSAAVLDIQVSDNPSLRFSKARGFQQIAERRFAREPRLQNNCCFECLQVRGDLVQLSCGKRRDDSVVRR